MKPGFNDESDVDKLGRLIDTTRLTRVHYLALALVVTGGLFEVLEQLILSALGPSLQQAFDIGATELSILSTATLLAIAGGGVSAGYLADRIGRRNVLAVSVGVYSLGSLLAAFSPSYEALIVTRIITGIGVGGEIAVGLAYLSELTPTRFRGLFTSLFNTVSAGVGMFVAYAYTLWVLGVFATIVGAGENAWRWAFGLLGLPAVLIFFLRRYLPESPRFLLEHGDIQALNSCLTQLGSGRVIMGPEAQVTAFFRSAAHAPTRSRNQLPLSARVRALLVHADSGAVTGLATCAFVAWGAQFSFIILMPLMLVDRGYSVSGSLTFTMMQNLGGLFGCVAASIGAYYFARRRMIAAGCLAAAVGIALFAYVATDTVSILVLGAAFQFSVMLVNTTIWTWAPELFPTVLRGLGTALIVNIGFIGGAVLPLLSTSMYEHVGELWVFVMVAAMYLGILLASRFVTETHGVPLERADTRSETDQKELRS